MSERPQAGPDEPPHRPVLLQEVIAALAPQAGETFIDGTFGAGGYTRAILEAAPARVLAIDRDPAAMARAQICTDQFGDRFLFRPGRFGALDRIALDAGLPRIDGVVLDIGVSSMQLNDPARGFSFMEDGPLDMRMSGEGATAAQLVNTLPEARLADLLFTYGEEKKSRLIARAVVHDRVTTPFTTTRQLAGLVFRLLGGRKADGRHPATRTFQALRIAVNDELGELEAGLEAAERVLKPGGRLVVVTFHSLEDRIVKRFLNERAGRAARGSRHLPAQSLELSAPSFRFVNARPLTPSQPELALNPRARSGRLRAAIRTDAAPEFQAAIDGSDRTV